MLYTSDPYTGKMFEVLFGELFSISFEDVNKIVINHAISVK